MFVTLVELRMRRLYDESATSWHRIARVDDEIHQHLFDLTLIGFDACQPRLQSCLQIDVFTDEAPQHLEHSTYRLVEIDDPGLENLLAAERKQLSHQSGRAFGGTADLIDVGL